MQLKAQLDRAGVLAGLFEPDWPWNCVPERFSRLRRISHFRDKH